MFEGVIMTIKVRFRGKDSKGRGIVMIRYNPADEPYLLYAMIQARDRKGTHPAVSVKGVDGEEIREPKPSKPPAVKPPEVKTG